MPRSGEEARYRLGQAALELFHERGYDQVTAAEIAARAGVTERTFFRHFADKREVLFGGEALFRAALIAAVAEAPKALGPLDTLLHAFHAMEHVFEGNRAFSEPRQRIIAATPALQERELAKAAALISGLTEALKARGVEEGLAALAAQTGMAALSHTVNVWLDDPSRGCLGAHLDRSFVQLRALSGG